MYVGVRGGKTNGCVPCSCKREENFFPCLSAKQSFSFGSFPSKWQYREKHLLTGLISLWPKFEMFSLTSLKWHKSLKINPHSRFKGRKNFNNFSHPFAFYLSKFYRTTARLEPFPLEFRAVSEFAINLYPKMIEECNWLKSFSAFQLTTWI